MRNNVSGYAGLKSIARKPDGGFCFVRVRSFLAAWIRFKREDISLFELRLFLASFEMIWIHEGLLRNPQTHLDTAGHFRLSMEFWGFGGKLPFINMSEALGLMRNHSDSVENNMGLFGVIWAH